jgi:DNA invertase Pin-like site-specific DNA recombinase
MALIGYARVSKEEQHLGLQLDALKKYGCVRIFKDQMTGTRFDRKELLAALAYVNEGDTIVVWRLDRLGRSLKQLIETLDTLKARKINLVSITEHLDTTSATGMLFFQFIAMLAEFERNLISERTKAGLTAARARGRVGGRKPLDLTQGKPMIGLKLYDETDATGKKKNSIGFICKTLRISRATLFRWVKMRSDQAQS